MPPATAPAARSTPFRRLWHPRLPELVESVRRSLRRAWRRVAWPVPPAAVLHVTHYKAGSQWILRILQELAEPWIVAPAVDGGQFLREPVRAGRVYPTLYVTREQFEQARLPRRWRRFVVIRDLRDTLVSGYFSLRVSHDPLHPQMAGYRDQLDGLSREDGLLRMIRRWCDPIAAIQRSWLGGPDAVLKYEDLLVRDVELLEPVLLGHCGLPVPADRLRTVVLANRFEARSGRRRGEEDVASHERKGVAGDWKNHFTDKVAKAFKDRFGELLVATGYEKDSRW
jgi:lipopolysaccharide transport system ATP-binding protein